MWTVEQPVICSERWAYNSLSGPEVLFKTCVAMKFVDDDDDDDDNLSLNTLVRPLQIIFSASPCSVSAIPAPTTDVLSCVNPNGSITIKLATNFWCSESPNKSRKRTS